jgi:DNA-binding response OmpR family regulator
MSTNESAGRVLVVEDEAEIRRFIRLSLQAESLDVAEAAGVQRGLIEAGTRRPDLVVLDLGLPDGDGIDFIRGLRTWSAIPIIVLSARTTETDKIAALDAGADDYLVKPFRLSELLARVRAHLRRQEHAAERREPIRAGALTVDVAARRAWLGDEELALRPKEFDVLALLASRAGEAVSREDLMAQVWDINWFGSTKTLDMHVLSLRQKLGPEAITTLRGVGYRLERE